MNQLIAKIESKKAVIGVIGLGYVGLPLASNFCRKGYNVIGFDIDKKKITKINKKKNYIKSVNLKKYKKKNLSNFKIY